ncbi:aspartic peptidase domain-containing protein [Ampelomyces quisqualis]|uniref:Aspartic peptidase domain-containing protein n=1 Tax=Ampelomyces quisqualis TaxID=50730 RepID=A0A6A5R1N8_AMPQU|nr:aspartic peptidase domain-containing protein [Ampelomyces quisqualis]
MHTSLLPWLALSAALLPTATAFYPYHYEDDSTTSNSRRTPSSPAVANTDSRSITLPIHRITTSSSLRTRQNAYKIVNSNDPKQANSVAIDQDGGDLSYMVAVTIGDSKEEYHLLLDSAASNTWVMGQDCRSNACKLHNSFGTSDSSSLKTQTTPFSVTYGTGSVSGTLATDTLHIGPLSPSLTFGLANDVSSEFSSYPMDGILGIGRGTADNIAAPKLLDVLSTSKLISAKIYGVHLSRATDGLSDGELNLGTVNKDRFTGDLNYVDCVPNDTGFWEVPVSAASVDTNSIPLASARNAIIDTGTSFILMPPSDALALHKNIAGYVQDGETFSVPCDTAATVQFSFNNVPYNISTADWRGGKLSTGLCRSNIVGRQTFGEKQWLVGDVFLKNVYSVFDAEKWRVGFGVKSAGAATPSASSAVPPPPTSAGVPDAAETGLVGSPGAAAPSSAAAEATQQDQKDELQKGAGIKRNAMSRVVVLLASSMFILG